MTYVGVVGSTGFIGGACAQALTSAGMDVIPIAAPRLTTSARSPQALRHAAEAVDLPGRLMADLRDCAMVLNAAGLADATSGNANSLFGANALLPAVLVRAARSVGVGRIIHISSAAVQGPSARLDQTVRLDPSSAYSASKAAGERVLPNGGDLVIYRPTSVHGPQRAVTHSLVRLARSRLSMVAGEGSSPTPQVHIDNVASAVTYLCRPDRQPPPIVLHPSEDWTTSSILRTLGGREPLHLPTALAHAGVGVTHLASGLRPAWSGHTRRLELVLFGQAQEPGWLDHQGFRGPADHVSWSRMARDIWRGSARPRTPGTGRE